VSPIDGISNIRRYPRIDKIRLGIKMQGEKGPYPKAVDYFVCPDAVKKIYGDKPTSLDIIFPGDHIDLIAPQWYKCYSHSQGKICQGDGKTCHRKIDPETGNFVGKDAKSFEWADSNCVPDDCPMYQKKHCRHIMSLMFMLPKVPGLGVYQLDTTSYYSIIAINSQLADDDGFVRKFTGGKVGGIPLVLSLVPQEVTPAGVGRKTIYTLNVHSNMDLPELLLVSGKSLSQILLPPLDDNEAPDDLIPPEILIEAEVVKPAPKAIAPPASVPAPAPKAPVASTPVPAPAQATPAPAVSAPPASGPTVAIPSSDAIASMAKVAADTEQRIKDLRVVIHRKFAQDLGIGTDDRRKHIQQIFADHNPVPDSLTALSEDDLKKINLWLDNEVARRSGGTPVTTAPPAAPAPAAPATSTPVSADATLGFTNANEQGILRTQLYHYLTDPDKLALTKEAAQKFVTDKGYSGTNNIPKVNIIKLIDEVNNLVQAKQIPTDF
jgi:hypothetical protein